MVYRPNACNSSTSCSPSAFTNVLVYVWATGVVPQRWKCAIIKILCETKDRTGWNKCKWNSLLAHVGISLLRIVASHLSNYSETKGLLPEEQCGFGIRFLPT